MQQDIAPGAIVECRDGRVGTVERLLRDERSRRVTDLIVRLDRTGQAFRVPERYVTRVRSSERVSVNCARERFEAEMVPLEEEGELGKPEELTVPVIAEHLVARKEVVPVGELQVRKVVEEEESSISEPVSYDEVIVERVPVGRRINEDPAPRQEGDTLIIPVVQEQLVCERQRVLVEEIRITRRRRSEVRRFTGTVRRERVVLDKGNVGDRVHELQRQPPDGSGAEGGEQDGSNPDRDVP